MVRVLALVNELVSTSIPVEIAARVHTHTEADVRLVSFYDRPEDELDPDVAALNVPTTRLDASSRLDPTAYRRLRALCAGEGDVLHTHHNAVGSFGRIATAGTGIAVVNTEHSDHRLFSRAQRAVNAVSYPRVDVLVSNSENTRASFPRWERVAARGCRHEVVYNGVDSDRIDAAGTPETAVPSGPLVVTVGRLIPAKNHATLLESFRAVLDERPEAHLVVVGDGPLRTRLQHRAADLGVRDSVTFTGTVPRAEVYALLDRATVAAFPSLFEGFCVAAVEAMAAGLPVVAGDIAVLHEVVDDPGVFVDPEDAEALADALVALLDDPERRDRLGASGRERARTAFSLDRTAQEYCKIYKQVAETSGQ